MAHKYPPIEICRELTYDGKKNFCRLILLVASKKSARYEDFFVVLIGNIQLH
jgi:hypothetical protein